MPSTSSTSPVLSSSSVSQPDNAGVTAKESDTDRVLLSMKFCFSAPPLTLFTLQWAYTMLLSPPPRKFLEPTLHYVMDSFPLGLHVLFSFQNLRSGVRAVQLIEKTWL